MTVLAAPADLGPIRLPRAIRDARGWLLIGWAAACWALWDLPLNNDISWQYWVARQLRHGFVFGADIAEINPPLWFWEAMPVSALADRLGVAATHLAVVATLARTAIGLALVASLSPPRGRVPAIAGLGVLLLALPVFSFAERDHLAVLGALPYAALAAARAQARPVSRWRALGVGLFAAWGFALKPYFLLPPLLLEAWLLLRLRRGWRPWRAELVAMATAAIGYAVAIVVFAPSWWTRVLPLARASYGDFAPPFAWLFLYQPYLPFWSLAVVALLIAGPRDARVQAGAITAAAFGGCYFLQGKGFPYHALPLTVTLGWTLWLMLCGDARPFAAAARRPLATLALATALGTTALIGPFTTPSLGALDRRIDALPPGTVFLVLSAHSWHAFPLVERHRFVWPMPGGITLMPLAAILRENPASVRGRALRRATLDLLADNLARCPPRVILVDDPAVSSVLPRGADYLEFVRSDPRLAAMLDRYDVAERADGMQLLVARRGRLPAATRCFTIAPAGAT